MFNGDFTIQDAEMYDPIAIAKLGPEARSILKSIQTEDSKLQSASQPARSDLHYFRARFNYYRLSLLRLLPEEKAVLEPVLATFLHRIVAFEGDAGAGQPGVTPFLTTVEKLSSSRPTTERTVVQPTSSATNSSSSRATRSTTEELISQLHLIKMALASDIDGTGRKALSDGLERVIQTLRG
jgi:hypothetical protein